MSLRKNQSGFASLEVALLVIVLAIVGFLAWKAYGGNQTASDTPAKQEVTADVPSAPRIDSTADLTAAETALDQIDPDPASDSTQLDSQLAAF